jgi:hypothetical protein
MASVLFQTLALHSPFRSTAFCSPGAQRAALETLKVFGHTSPRSARSLVPRAYPEQTVPKNYFRLPSSAGHEH